MTREELYASIYTHDTIYLPPWEEQSAPLEVALGCSWGKCRFCDFAKDTFSLHSDEKIEENLKILSKLQPENPRVFFLGENAFVIESERLLRLFSLVRTYMPQVKEFAMYSRIDDVLRKTPEELELLKKAGLSDLHLGLESGSDPILDVMNKGVTSADMRKGFHMLDRAGIGYYVTVILGLGGRTFSRLHAIETAKFLNTIHPKDIWCLKLHLFPGTPLYRESKRGHFDPMTPEEILREEYLLLENLTVKDYLFEDTTVLNTYTLRGRLPEQKEELLRAMEYLSQMADK